MSSVLIIGAGGVGRVVAHKCAQNSDIFSTITLASRTLSKCEQIASEIKNVKIDTKQVDLGAEDLVEKTNKFTTDMGLAIKTGDKKEKKEGTIRLGNIIKYR